MLTMPKLFENLFLIVPMNLVNFIAKAVQLAYMYSVPSIMKHVHMTIKLGYHDSITQSRGSKIWFKLVS
jgi:hypothetical protein